MKIFKYLMGRERGGESREDRGFLNILWGIYESSKENAKPARSLKKEHEKGRL